MNEPVRVRQEIALIFDSTMLGSPCVISARQARQDRRALDLRAQAKRSSSAPIGWNSFGVSRGLSRSQSRERCKQSGMLHRFDQPGFGLTLKSARGLSVTLKSRTFRCPRLWRRGRSRPSSRKLPVQVAVGCSPDSARPHPSRRRAARRICGSKLFPRAN